MHRQSPPLTIGRTVLKESDDPVSSGVTFDSKMTFEKHLCSVSRADSRRLCILRKSWRVFHDRSLLGRCFWGFVLPVLEYRSAVWCSAANTHIKLLDWAVSGTQFLSKWREQMHPFCCYSNENVNCHSIQATRKKYANNIKCTPFIILHNFIWQHLLHQEHGMHAMTLMHIYLFSVSINRMLIFQLKWLLCGKFMFSLWFSM